MGWICRTCGSENEFAVEICQACLRKEKSLYIFTERFHSRIALGTNYDLAQVQESRCFRFCEMARKQRVFFAARRCITFIETFFVLAVVGFLAAQAMSDGNMLQYGTAGFPIKMEAIRLYMEACVLNNTGKVTANIPLHVASRLLDTGTNAAFSRISGNMRELTMALEAGKGDGLKYPYIFHHVFNRSIQSMDPIGKLEGQIDSLLKGLEQKASASAFCYAKSIDAILTARSHSSIPAVWVKAYPIFRRNTNQLIMSTLKDAAELNSLFSLYDVAVKTTLAVSAGESNMLLTQMRRNFSVLLYNIGQVNPAVQWKRFSDHCIYRYARLTDGIRCLLIKDKEEYK